jgi:hypothetical protein
MNMWNFTNYYEIFARSVTRRILDSSNKAIEGSNPAEHMHLYRLLFALYYPV